MLYKLKRELPYASIGDEVIIKGTGSWQCAYVIINAYGNKREIPITYGNSIEYLIKDGWIEPIKSREFQLVIVKNTGITRFVKEMITVAYPVGAIIPNEILSKDAEIIKVREVSANE